LAIARADRAGRVPPAVLGADFIESASDDIATRLFSCGNSQPSPVSTVSLSKSIGGKLPRVEQLV
jgi:hypothetical protein